MKGAEQRKYYEVERLRRLGKLRAEGSRARSDKRPVVSPEVELFSRYCRFAARRSGHGSANAVPTEIDRAVFAEPLSTRSIDN